MATVLKIGPGDHGRAMTLEEFEAGDYQEGYQYEIIDGKLYVSPLANAPQGRLLRWIYKKLDRYSDDHPEVINYVHPAARVFVHDRTAATIPEPDLTAYRDYPVDQSLDDDRWQDVNPILVVEVLSADDPDKDLVRNVELYFEVPTIKEYWVIDSRESANRPSMRVHRRYGKRWRIIDLAYGDVYTTRLLPGFALTIDPHR
jgi:Uma2 family endonuclease